MNSVIENIEYLVRRHDCVVLPSWGAFIAHYKPAYYDDEANLYYPPVRELTFNASVSHSDGLLTASLARRYSVPFTRAQKMVDDDLTAMRRQLDADGEVSLGTVGRFIRQQESTVIFEPSTRYALYDSSCFGAVEAKPLMVKAREEAEAAIVADERRGRLSRLGLKAVKAAAAAAVVAVVAGVAWVLTMPGVFNRNDNFASVSSMTFNATQSTESAAADDGDKALYIMCPQMDECVEAEQADAELFDSSLETEQATDAAVDAVVTSVAADSDDRYCLVVASLVSQSQAERFIAEDGSNGLRIYHSDGKYRVYAASGKTLEETLAMKSADGLADRYPDAWVCRMK